MRFPPWMGYELRRLGGLGLAMPALVALAFGAIAGLMALLGTETHRVARAFSASLELGLPMGAGLVAAALAADDPALDLQLTLRTRYRVTLARRLGLLVGWTSLVAFALAGALRLAGLWAVPGPFLVGQLSWLSPLVWLVALGALLSLVGRSRALGGAVLGGLWVLENTFGAALFVSNPWLRPFFLFATTHTPGAEYWLGNRLALLGSALAMALAVLALLSRSEALATGGEA